MHLTIAYITSRREPRIQWFFDSLHLELGGCYESIGIIVVDFWANEAGRKEEIAKLAYCDIIHVPPKPTVWQGEYKLTMRDYFAAANSRNTALCYAPDGWIAYVDDLSFLTPGWMSCVREAIEKRYVVLGAYAKLNEMVVEKGVLKSFRLKPENKDSRMIYATEGKPVIATGSWMYGCSLACPVDKLLEINGWDEDCDGLGGEDTACGIMLQHAGCVFRYDPRMLTYESEEDHWTGHLLARPDKGVSPKDKSHAYQNMLLSLDHPRKIAPNYFGEGGIAKLRTKILAGEKFPVLQIPQHDWYDGQPLIEM